MKNSLLFVILLLLLGLSMVVALSVGQYPIESSMWIAFLQGEASDVMHTIVVELRLPRILAALLVGAALAISGSAFQSMFVNPLVSPSLLGVLAGASFGAALGIVWEQSWWGVQFLTFVFGALAVLVAMGIASMYRGGSTVLLLVLGGIVSSALFTSLLSIVKYAADPYTHLPSIVYWLMGSFSMVEWDTLGMVALPMALGMVTLVVLGSYINVLSMGDEEAKALGVNVTRVRIIAIGAATLISSLTVVVAGVIGWVGLVIPHIARMIVGPNNRVLLPMSALMGGLYLLWIDTATRTLFRAEVPIGILTALVGIPVFVLLLREGKKGWN
ncbi:MAG: ABC transporter permease [Sulfuricurvum sp. PC08-66]|nr:MAG: ABC transporter permease [Sulfuricurvum sp. PC08-66]